MPLTSGSTEASAPPEAATTQDDCLAPSDPEQLEVLAILHELADHACDSGIGVQLDADGVLWHLGGEPVDTAITVSVLEQVKAAGWLEELKVNGARRWGLTERAVDLLDDSITAAAPTLSP